jgi:SNF2 family DNA or RNA helicase
MLKPLYTSHIILTTYGVVRNDLEILGKIDFEYIVLDESQLIKNPDSQSYKAVKQLNSRHKLTLTGTPIENSLTDLWSQLSFTNPGLLGGFDMFRREFVLPIEKKNDEMARKRLKALINPFILRRTKDQVAKDLPPLTEKLFYCDMTEKQHELYEREKSHYRNIILQNIEQAGIEKSKMVIFQGLMKLRLIANHPAMTTVTSAEETHLEGMHHFGSGKFIEVTRMLESLRSENHKVLIFSQFVKHLNLFKDWFEEHKIPYSYLIGNTTNRKDVIEQFEGSPETKFFLISLKAGGVGLNLTSADYVFMLDPWWNPAVEAQAINRAHRIGQTKNVIAYKFICKGTIEEKIVQLQQRKSALAEDFINHNNPLSSLSTQEVADLFK